MKCTNCFSTLHGTESCASCGFVNNETERDHRALPGNFLLAGKYVIGRVLGSGGFGITYLALDTKLNRRVALKEFLPNEIAGRAKDGLSVRCHSFNEDQQFRQALGRFFKEGEVMARFDHPNIVRAYEVFEGNGTAYLAMEYLDGQSLRQILHGCGNLTEVQAKDILTFVLDALKVTHAHGVLHRDLKPDNIYVTKEGRTLLLDFGGAKDFVGAQSHSLMAIFSHGYAAPEQYHGNDARAGPWTDVYGAAALLYKLVTGKTPRSALERLSDDGALDWTDAAVSRETRAAIERGMAIKASERPQTIGEFQDALIGQLPALQIAEAVPKRPGCVGPTLLVGFFVIVIAGAVAYIMLNSRERVAQLPVPKEETKLESDSQPRRGFAGAAPTKDESPPSGTVVNVPSKESPARFVAPSSGAPVMAKREPRESDKAKVEKAKQLEAQSERESAMVSAILDEGETCYRAKKFDCAISSANAALRVKQDSERALSLKEQALSGQKRALEGITIQ